MKILIDTNIIIDHLLKRSPYYKAAGQIFAETEQGKLTTFISATTVTTIYYLVTKALGADKAVSTITELLRLFEIAPINRTVLDSALGLDFSDYEDAVIHEAAVHSGAQMIITRNLKDFKNAKLAIFSPEEFVLTCQKLVN